MTAPGIVPTPNRAAETPAVAGHARRWAVVALIIVAAIVPLVWAPVARLTAPSDGTMTYPSSPPWTANGAVIVEVVGQPGDLRAGDRVIAVDGVALEIWAGARPDRSFRVGDRVQYQITRSGAGAGEQVLDIDVTLRRYPLWEKIAAHIITVPLVVLLMLVASFVFLRRPGDPAARALFAIGALVPLGMTAFPLATQIIDLANGPRLWPFILGDAANALVWGALLHFSLVFPEPRGFVRRHLRSVVVAAYALPFLLHAGYLAVTLPTASGTLGRLGRLIPVSLVAGHVFPFLVGAVMIAGYRAAREGAIRRRMRWVFYTFCLGAVLYVGLGQLPDTVIGHPLVPWDWQPLFFLPFPVALAAAVLRYGLFDIEVIIRRSLVYGGLTVLLVLVYLAAVALLTRLFHTGSDLVPVLAAALVAVLFQPLRTRLKRLISRTIFGDRDDPYEVLTRLGGQLEATTPTESVLTGIVETLAHTLRLPYAAIELDGPAEAMDVAVWGTRSGQPISIPLVHQGEQIGRLMLDPGPGREPFGRTDHRLIEALSRQVGLTAHNVLLTTRLQRSLQRTVTAREEERRRLRRDIHDGVGPALAAVTIRLDVARRIIGTEPEKAAAILADLAESQQALVVDVRRLVEGLRPPVLDQLGLLAALREHAQSLALTTREGAGLRVTVEQSGEVEPLPAAVEVAAYHIVLEALTNAARHAHAHTCTVGLRRDEALHIEVTDDGSGLPKAYRAGVGLNSIRERAGELGGTAVITAGTGGGTVVRARLPLPQEWPG